MCKLTIGCCSSTVLSRSPCSQNSAATDKATWKIHTNKHTQSYVGVRSRTLSESLIDYIFVRLTLLCTSHGLVIADKSHAVIIIALKWKRFRGSEKCKRTKNYVRPRCTHMTISFLVVSRDMKSTHFFSSSYVCERSTIFWNMVLFLARCDERNCFTI